MESYAEGNYGKIGLALTNEDHNCWSQIRNPSEIINLETLDEKFLDQDIDIIFTKLFGRTNKNNEDTKTSLGWFDVGKQLNSTESKKKK
jgi:hypothetical protein